jgi:hypothetical protein
VKSETLKLKFHWWLLQGGERSTITRDGGVSRGTGMPDLEAQIDFCRKAEEAGLQGLQRVSKMPFRTLLVEEQAFRPALLALKRPGLLALVTKPYF